MLQALEEQPPSLLPPPHPWQKQSNKKNEKQKQNATAYCRENDNHNPYPLPVIPPFNLLKTFRIDQKLKTLPGV